ncbi:hypothetical protein P22_2201 [Propionispora sp. 2/2-37]|uniref:hypothetical protein n=1 Tax=Propionispora sp. 2/2-37 TaxID=1677858 RepID=UPI0006BB6CF1|nr:hypothetical protein [Propionispora sp. 2/2-37]CUH96113.1 hypothetical protein P22_2201 [Propionispora sp. 2/2-37]
MYKLRFAGCLALVVAVLTLTISVVHGARPMTILYRTFISIGIFGISGFIFGSIVERFFGHILSSLRPQEDQDDLVEGVKKVESKNATKSVDFTPFTPENLARIVKDQID